ncbi:MAG: hypothetical protein IJR52_09180 [Selenomonadaceae bacterium]|nr:hypothetical protein [Selenomonadaceae bacterium]MBQ9497727.1 hypothetical protein [Selenomonadaceae bacterium]
MPGHLIKIFLLTAFLVAAIHAPTFAGITEPLEIVNETGKTILSLYAVPIQKKSWGNDLVGSGVMNQGDRRSIHYDTDFTRYKIKIEFADGSTLTRNDVDLLDTWRLSLMRDGSCDKNVRG